MITNHFSLFTYLPRRSLWHAEGRRRRLGEGGSLITSRLYFSLITNHFSLSDSGRLAQW